MEYLCDTNVVGELMRREPDPRLLQWFRTMDRVFISVITVEETLFGLRRKGLVHKEAWFRRFLLGAAEVVPVDGETAAWAGERRGEHAAAGMTRTQADALIAACAWRRGLVVATRNVRDFEGYGLPVFNP
ncbi:MAG: hypothetical protein A2413_10555, partial [Treponema sp. RIFOXYC1_FULL_61_9]